LTVLTHLLSAVPWEETTALEDAWEEELVRMENAIANQVLKELIAAYMFNCMIF